MICIHFTSTTLNSIEYIEFKAPQVSPARHTCKKTHYNIYIYGLSSLNLNRKGWLCLGAGKVGCSPWKARDALISLSALECDESNPPHFLHHPIAYSPSIRVEELKRPAKKHRAASGHACPIALWEESRRFQQA